VTMCEASASLLPLVTEEIYRGLTGEQSVHLTDFPDVSHITDDGEIVSQMDRVRDICNAGLSIRNKANARVRQPLSVLQVYGSKELNFVDIIQSELNIKRVEFVADFADVAEKKLQINFPIVGKRIPDKIKQIIPLSKQGKWEQVGDKVHVGGEILEEGEFKILLEPKKEYANCSAPLSTNDALVVLDLEITPELELEGIARDIVRMIQQARKDADLNVADKIDIAITVEDDKIQSAITDFNAYITEQTLGNSLVIGDINGMEHQFENKLGDITMSIGFVVS